MAIYRPGLRGKKQGGQEQGQRSPVVTLSLTAMADVFTVLVIFLLQNLFVTGEVLDLYSDVELPEARKIKELKPANVVVISDKYLMLNNDLIEGFEEFKKSEACVWRPLKTKLETAIQLAQRSKQDLVDKVQQEVQARRGKEEEEVPTEFRLTIQSDKKIEFALLKKVMYTITQAGVREINFAVIPKKQE